MRLFKRRPRTAPGSANPAWLEMHLVNQPEGTYLVTATHVFVKDGMFFWKTMGADGGVEYLDRTLAHWAESRVYWLS